MHGKFNDFFIGFPCGVLKRYSWAVTAGNVMIRFSNNI